MKCVTWVSRLSRCFFLEIDDSGKEKRYYWCCFCVCFICTCSSASAEQQLTNHHKPHSYSPQNYPVASNCLCPCTFVSLPHLWITFSRISKAVLHSTDVFFWLFGNILLLITQDVIRRLQNIILLQSLGPFWNVLVSER